MKKKFYRSCVAVLLSMVMIFGGVHIGAGAVKPGLPPIISTPEVEITNTQNILTFGETMQMTYSANMSGGDVYWSINEDSNVATISSSGLVTAKKYVGICTVTATYEIGGMTAFDTLTLRVTNGVVGIENNAQYYVMNSSAKKLLSLTEQTDAAHSFVNIRDMSNSDISKWIVEFQSDNTVQFINVYSPTAKCLTVGNLYLHIDTDTNTNAAQKFTLERVTEGTYRGLYLIKNGDYFVSLGENNVVCLTTTKNERSYWSFMEVNKGKAQLYGFKYYRKVNGVDSLYDSTTKFNNIKTDLTTMGYLSLSHENLDVLDAYSFLQTDDIFVYAGHGENGRLSFCDEDKKETNQRTITGDKITGEIVLGMILAHKRMNDENLTFPNHYCINELSENQLSGARCVLYLACLSGKSYTNSKGTYNLVDETFNKGAHFVLGTTAKVSNLEVDPWMEAFFESALNGNSIEQCIADADDVLGERIYETDNGSKTCDGLPIYIKGDLSQYLYFGG